MKLLYLFSLINDYTLPNFKDFLLTACQGDYHLLVLMQISEQGTSLLELIKQTDLDLDLERIHLIAPSINDKTAPTQTIELLEKATGLLVLGGNAHFYQKIYASPEISQIILEKYNSGVPYAGVSAGAILALNYELINDLAIKPHFSEKKRFNELLNKMKKNKVNSGFGLDDNISLKIIDNKQIKCIGKDSFYLFTKKGVNEFSFKIFKNLEELKHSN